MYIPVAGLVLLGSSCLAIGIGIGILIVLTVYHQDYRGLCDLCKDILEEQRSTLNFMSDSGVRQLKLLKEVLEEVQESK